MDDVIAEELRNRLVKWENNFQNWEILEIPRLYLINKNCEVEFHIFADASTTSYSAVVNLYFVDKSKYKRSFIMSKLRLAPSKKND